MKTSGTTLRLSYLATRKLPFVLTAAAIGTALALAGLSVLRGPAASRPAASDQPALVYDATGAMLAAIGPAADNSAVLPGPVYDATGAMLAAIATESPRVPAATRLAPVYDATGAMLTAIAPQAASGRAPVQAVNAITLIVIERSAPSYKPLPVYDATGAMWLAVPSIKP